MKKILLFLLIASLFSVGVFAQAQCSIPVSDPVFTCQTGVSSSPVSPAVGAQLSMGVSGWDFVYEKVYKWTGTSWVQAGVLTGAVVNSGGWVVPAQGSSKAVAALALASGISADTTFAVFACNALSSSPLKYNCNGEITIGSNGVTGSGKWMLHRVTVASAPTTEIRFSYKSSTSGTAAAIPHSYCPAIVKEEVCQKEIMYTPPANSQLMLFASTSNDAVPITRFVVTDKSTNVQVYSSMGSCTSCQSNYFTVPDSGATYVLRAETSVGSCTLISSCPSVEWSACSAGSQTRSCSDGCGGVKTETQSCTIAGCTNQCSLSQYKCSNANMYSCALGSNGCLVWNSLGACRGGNVCNAAGNNCCDQASYDTCVNDNDGQASMCNPADYGC